MVAAPIQWVEAEWLKLAGGIALAIAAWFFRRAMQNNRPLRNGSKAQLMRDVHDLKVRAAENEARTLAVEVELADMRVWFKKYRADRRV